MMLELNQVTASYDSRTTVLKNISLKVGDGQIVALIGANGAGKTTTMRIITGVLKPVSGQVSYAGKILNGLPSHQVVSHGIALVPEGRRVFPKLTIQENLEVGGYPLRHVRGAIKKNLDQTYALFSVLSDRRGQRAETLSGGEQQMLALGRALMSNPSMLLLDEPSLGVAPQLVRRIYEYIAQINSHGVSILLVEQNAKLALRVSNYAYVIQLGKIVLEGPSEELSKDPRVEAAYLGTLKRKAVIG
jgi:branched-chain amino acid transport system ATP-binding protein